MGEWPIIFSGPMVRAILEGRKTQTRRVVRAPDIENADVWSRTPDELGRWEWGMSADGGAVGHGGFVRCPFGAPGDTLWVRETFAVVRWLEDDTEQMVGPLPIKRPASFDVAYKTCHPNKAHVEPYVQWPTHRDDLGFSWRSPIHMPRWASRLTLRITDVRVERLQEISEEDAYLEGVGTPGAIERMRQAHGGSTEHADARVWFRNLWDSINGKRAPWSSNPWVWVVSFERVKEGVRG